jgi:hypothetical protein
MNGPHTAPDRRSWPHASSMAWIAAIIVVMLVAGAALYNSGRNTSTSAVVPAASTGQSPSPNAPSTNQ